MRPKQIMIVDEDAELIRILNAVVKPLNVEIRVAGTGRKAIQQIERMVPSVLLINVRLPDMDAGEILRIIEDHGLPVTPILMASNGASRKALLEASDRVYDVLTKPLEFDRLRLVIRNALERDTLIESMDDLSALHSTRNLHSLRGSSPAIRHIYAAIRRLAPDNNPITVYGSRGTERNLVAESIHLESPRADKPFIYMGLSGIPPEEMTAALVGIPNLQGALEAADGGTLFLDDVRLLTPDARRALLHCHEHQVVDRPNEPPLPIDVRLVLGVLEHENETPGADPAEEEFLQAVGKATVRLPPLAQRGVDVLEWAEHFLCELSNLSDKHFSTLSTDAESAMLSYQWPGNVEELLQALRCAVEEHGGPVLRAHMLPQEIRDSCDHKGHPRNATEAPMEIRNMIKPLWLIEKETIESALKLTDNNVFQAARLLEVPAAMIYRKQRSWRERNL